MSKIFTQMDAPELESLMDEWKAVHIGHENDWAKLFNTKNYQQRCKDIESVQKKLDTYFRVNYPKHTNWKLQNIETGRSRYQPKEHMWNLILTESK